MALVDGSTTGDGSFYFLPPLVKSPSIVGTFNPNLLPALRVCALDGAGECVVGPPAAYFGPGSASVSEGQYQISWDTDGPETAPLDHTVNYRINVEVGGVVVGYLDVNPQDPSGTTPGEDTEGLMAFRLGETIPVKFWLSVETLCTSADPAVIECIAGAVIDESGGSLVLEEQGDRLALLVEAGALPGENHPPVTVVAERIDPDIFFATTGVECIPLFDAPQFGPCFRITTYPLLTAPLDAPALISICLDPASLAGINFPLDQEEQLQIVRYADNGSNVREALSNVPGDCPVQTASLFEVPKSGILRYLAMGANAVANFVGPQPLVAHGDIGLGGLTSSFSRFRFALPGEMQLFSGDGAVIQAADPPVVEAVVKVVDEEGVPVENATVHFSTSDGSVSAADVDTDVNGLATTTWTVANGAPGTKTLSAAALGLVSGVLPDHGAGQVFSSESVTFTATVVGPPASILPSSGSGQTGTAGEPLADPLVVTVTDSEGYPVSGATVTWTASGDGSVSGGTTTGSDGTASGTWTLATTSGTNTATATVGSLPSVEFTATGQAGDAATIVAISSLPATGLVGETFTVLVEVQDQYGNARTQGGDVVTWSPSGGGVAAPASGNTNTQGRASTAWTLDAMPGLNTLTAATGAASASFSMTGECFDGYGIASIDGAMGAAEWACAQSLPFEANLSGGSTPAFVYWMNDGTNLYMAVKVQQASFDKANSIRFDFDNDNDGVHEENDDAIGYDADARAFFDEHLTKKCANSGQSGCGVSDASLDGAGAAANDGTWTTYELSHPLNSGEVGDIAAAKDDFVGFFLTLRVGKGAQGNTQFPGFRVFQSILIVGLP